MPADMPISIVSLSENPKESVMAPRISVCRKGDDIFFTVKGGFTAESFQELLAVVRQILMMSLKGAAPGSQVTYNLKTRGKVDLEKMSYLHHAINDQPCFLDSCGPTPEEQKHGFQSLQENTPQSHPRHGLFLVKGGTL